MAFNSGPKGIITDGLIFYIDPGNGSSYISGSSNIDDLISPSVTGSFKSTDVIYSDDGNGSLDFDGNANDFIEFPTFSSIIGTANVQNITYSAWIKAGSSIGSYDGIMGTQTSPTSDGGAMYWRDHFSTSKLYADFNYGAGSTRVIPNVELGATSLNKIKEWNEVTWTYNGSNSIIYLNGELGESLSATGDVNDMDEIKDLGLSGVGYYWDGNISCVRMYNRALTASEITQNYNSLKSRFGK